VTPPTAAEPAPGGEAVAAARAALPPAFVARLERILPAEDLERALAGFALPRPVAVRVNTLRAAPEEVRRALEADGLHPEPVPGLPEALVLPPQERERLTRHPLHLEGILYPQGLASQLAAPLLDPRPGEEVLDLCAAPGGKALHLAARMRDHGRVAAVEAARERYFRLRANLERAGATCVRPYLRDGTRLDRLVPGRFHRALVDAPCSAEARFHLVHPESFRYWGPHKIRELARKQRRLLLAGLRCLRPGGVLLYATCSFAPEENEAVVEAALAAMEGEVEVLPLEPSAGRWQEGLGGWEGRPFRPELRRARRILPDPLFQGFFYCLLRRRPRPPRARGQPPESPADARPRRRPRPRRWRG